MSKKYIDTDLGYLPTTLNSTLYYAKNYDWYSDGRAPITVNLYSAKVDITYDEYKALAKDLMNDLLYTKQNNAFYVFIYFCKVFLIFY